MKLFTVHHKLHIILALMSSLATITMTDLLTEILCGGVVGAVLVWVEGGIPVPWQCSVIVIHTYLVGD